MQKIRQWPLFSFADYWPEKLQTKDCFLFTDEKSGKHFCPRERGSMAGLMPVPQNFNRNIGLLSRLGLRYVNRSQSLSFINSRCLTRDDCFASYPVFEQER